MRVMYLSFELFVMGGTTCLFSPPHHPLIFNLIFPHLLSFLSVRSFFHFLNSSISSSTSTPPSHSLSLLLLLLLLLLLPLLLLLLLLPIIHYPYSSFSSSFFPFFTAAAAHEVNVRMIDSNTVGVSFGEAITREDTVNLLAGEILDLHYTVMHSSVNSTCP